MNKKNNRIIIIDRIKAHPIRTFLVLTFFWSWLIWSGLYIVLPGGMYQTPGVQRELPPSYIFFFIAGGMGPSLMGVIMTRLTSRGTVKSLFTQILHWEFKKRWIAAALLTAPVLAVAARAMQSLAGYDVPDIMSLQMVIPTAVMGILAGFLEEFGWRGFFLPKLLERFKPFAAGLIVGIPWGLWHFVPAFWGVGSIYGSRFWLFFFIADLSNLTAYSILMAYLCNSVKNRIHLAILFHASMSASISIFLADLPSTTGTIHLLGFFSVVVWASVLITAVFRQSARFF